MQQISYWVATEIVAAEGVASQISALKKFIEVAEVRTHFCPRALRFELYAKYFPLIAVLQLLTNMNEFNAAAAVVLGLGHMSVTRLRAIWKEVSTSWMIMHFLPSFALMAAADGRRKKHIQGAGRVVFATEQFSPLSPISREEESPNNSLAWYLYIP
jgi:hypothetical protein